MKSPLKNLPKSVKYLVCYLPFILVGTVLIVVGVFQENSARIASIIVGIVVLLSGLFAWCTDTDVGCLLICRYSSSKQKQRQQQESITESGQDERTKTPTNSDSRARSPDIEAAINHTTTFTITNNRTTIINGRVDSPVNNNYEDIRLTEKLTATRAITNNSMDRYGNYSLQQKPTGRVRRQRFGDDTMVKEPRVGAFGTLRNRDGDAMESNGFGNFGNFGRGIKKNRKSRLTITNVTALNTGMINKGFHHSSEGDLKNIPYDPAFNIESFMDRVKHKTISNWVTNVTNSMEDLMQTGVYPDPLSPVYIHKHYSSVQQHRQPSTDTSNSTRTDPLAPPNELDEAVEDTMNIDELQQPQQHQKEEEDTEIQVFRPDHDENHPEDEQTLGSDGDHEEYDIDEFMGKEFLLKFGFVNESLENLKKK